MLLKKKSLAWARLTERTHFCDDFPRQRRFPAAVMRLQTRALHFLRAGAQPSGASRQIRLTRLRRVN